MVSVRHLFRSSVGRCEACEHPSIFLCTSDNLKESRRCVRCRANSRSRQLARVLAAEYSATSLSRVPFDELDVYEAQAFGPIHVLLREVAKTYVCSEYLDDVPSGEIRHGIRCEDLQVLTFPNNSFDLVLHQSVLEHVPDPAAALRETARVLRPGGRMIFEVPVCNYWEPGLRAVTTTRVTADGEHLLSPPVYHGDPLRREGALVYSDFGMDLVDHLEALGLIVTSYVDEFRRSKMSHSVVFAARKPDRSE